MTARRGVIAGLAAAVITLLPAAAPAAADTSTSAGSTFRMALSSQVSTFNPFLAYFSGELTALGMVYPSLVSYDETFGDFTPYLADTWTTSEDGLTWTFRLHSGLTWSDGEPLTADDVAWTYQEIMTDPTAGTANGSLVENIASVTAPDDTTVVLTTKQPQANMLSINVPITGIPIVPRHVWESRMGALEDEKNTEFPVVGYGPYVLTGYTTDQFATLKANADFAGGAPGPDTLVLQYFKNNDAAVAALRSGQVDQTGLSATQYTSLKGVDGVTTYQTPGTRWSGFEVNGGARTQNGTPLGTGHPALKDPQVRLAIATAMDRQTLVDKVLNGFGTAGAGYVPPGYPQFSWEPDADEAADFDPAEANSTLDAAGYTRGADGVRVDPASGRPLVLRLGIHADNTTDSQVAEYVVGWLRDVGITVNVESQSTTALNANLAKGDWDLLMDSWGTSPDPSYLLSIQTCGALPAEDGTGGSTDAFYCNPDYDALYARQQTEFDPDTRAATIAQMQQILYGANYDVVLFYAAGLSAVRTSAWTGFSSGTPDADGNLPLQNSYLAMQRVAAVSDPAQDSRTSTGTVVWIVVAVVVVAGVVAFVVIRRRATAGDRE